MSKIDPELADWITKRNEQYLRLLQWAWLVSYLWGNGTADQLHAVMENVPGSAIDLPEELRPPVPTS